MKKHFKPFSSDPPRPKAAMQLIDAFTEAYKPVPDEDLADDLFTIARIREYFNAWPIPKMPDPMPAYLDELEKRGFAMQTSYDGSPAIFCAYRRAKGTPTYAIEASESLDMGEDGKGCSEEEEDDFRTGEAQLRELIALRMANRPEEEEPFPPYGEDGGEEEEEDEEEEEENGEEE